MHESLSMLYMQWTNVSSKSNNNIFNFSLWASFGILIILAGS